MVMSPVRSILKSKLIPPPGLKQFLTMGYLIGNSENLFSSLIGIETVLISKIFSYTGTLKVQTNPFKRIDSYADS